MEPPLPPPPPPPADTFYAERLTRRTRTAGSGCAPFLLLLFGIAMMFYAWPIGIITIVIAIVIDQQTSTHHYCGACGNDVAPTSTLCPTCHLPLQAAPWKFRQGIAAGILVFFLLLAALMWWLAITG